MDWRRGNLGIQVFCLAFSTTLLAIAWLVPGLNEHFAGRALVAFAHLLIAFHVLALFAAAWRIFRQDESWPRVVLVVVAVIMTGYVLLSVGYPSLLLERVLVAQATRMVGYAWCTYECFRYADLLRKRVMLGLGNPSMVHRFRLWGVACLAQLAGSLLMLASTVLPIPPSIIYFVQSPLAATAVICIGLAFFPPAFYRRWIEVEPSPLM